MTLETLFFQSWLNNSSLFLGNWKKRILWHDLSWYLVISGDISGVGERIAESEKDGLCHQSHHNTSYTELRQEKVQHKANQEQKHHPYHNVAAYKGTISILALTDTQTHGHFTNSCLHLLLHMHNHNMVNKSLLKLCHQSWQTGDF